MAVGVMTTDGSRPRNRDRRPGVGFRMQHLDQDAITQYITATIPGVDGVEKCFVRKMGYQLFVDMHVEVDPQMTVLHSHEIAHQVKDKVRETMPNVSDVLVHIEPLNIPAGKMPA